MIDISDIKIDVVENDGKVGVFKIGPLPKGYGHTFANPLRRVLLSSISGAAITSIRIAGVEHEYSALKGIKETMVEIQMNLKAVRLSCESSDPQVIRIKKKGKGDVSAGDFELTESVSVMNPDVKIATVTDSAVTFELEAVVERGTGYRLADEDLRSEVGRLPMQADFSPVERVMFSVEKTRKGEKMDLDLVMLTVVTDGSIEPLEALGRSAEMLKSTFEKVWVLTGGLEDTISDSQVEEPKSDDDEISKWLVEELQISKRAKTRLLAAGLTTVGDLLGKTSAELLAIPGFGDTALKEVKKFLEEYQLSISE